MILKRESRHLWKEGNLYLRDLNFKLIQLHLLLKWEIKNSLIKLVKYFDSIKIWYSAFVNSFFCLIGCAIGDFGTILYIQLNSIVLNNWLIMFLAMVNGIVTSVAFETIILLKKMSFIYALKTALGMSLISMIIMEFTMNMADLAIMGGFYLSIKTIPVILLAGWIAAAPYNYYRLKEYDIACH